MAVKNYKLADLWRLLKISSADVSKFEVIVDKPQHTEEGKKTLWVIT